MKKRTNRSHKRVQESGDWVNEVLSAAGKASGNGSFTAAPDDKDQNFHERCLHAAETAAILVRLRQERNLAGFAPVPYSEYIQGLARRIGVSLEPVLHWLRIKDMHLRGADTAGALARLAKEIGCSLPETLTLLAAEFAETHGHVYPRTITARCRPGSGQSVALPSGQFRLKELIAAWPADVRQQFQQITEQTEKVFNSE